MITNLKHAIFTAIGLWLMNKFGDHNIPTLAIWLPLIIFAADILFYSVIAAIKGQKYD